MLFLKNKDLGILCSLEEKFQVVQVLVLIRFISRSKSK